MILTQQRPPSVVSRLFERTRQALPCNCLLCGADSPESLVCPDCCAELPTLPTPRCPHCSEPTAHGERCGSCLQHEPHFDRTIAPWRYAFPIDRLIHGMKYGHQLAITEWCGGQIAERIIDKRFDHIIPMPLHPSRLAERGFNQSAEIARTIGRRINCPVDYSGLLRNKATPAQAELPLKARRSNVRGAFESKRDFSGQRILLVDDVMTSGATVDECARVLRLHGAIDITVAVVARALKHA